MRVKGSPLESKLGLRIDRLRKSKGAGFTVGEQVRVKG